MVHAGAATGRESSGAVCICITLILITYHESFDGIDFSSAVLAGTSTAPGCVDPALFGHPVGKDTAGNDHGSDDDSDSVCFLTPPIISVIDVLRC